MAPPDAVIQLRGIRALCICGALPEEQDRRQPYEFDVDIVADLPATTTDVLADTIDYGAVLDRIGALPGVGDTESLIQLSTKIDRAV